MYRFNLEYFLLDKRITIHELASLLKIPVQSLYAIKNRKTIKLKMLRYLEQHFGDCSKYLVFNSEKLSQQMETI